MPNVLIMNGKNQRFFAGETIRQIDKKVAGNPKVLSFKEKSKRNMKDDSNGTRSSLVGGGFFIIIFAVFSCAFYLFQVNDMATMGYKVRDVENTIQDLEKENKKMQIREIELKSMYALEKATESLGLVNSSDITYMEMKGPVAMK